MIHDHFVKRLESIQVFLTEEQYRKFDQYYEILMKWNQICNLTAITDYEEVLLKHYVDSLTLKIPIDHDQNQSKKCRMIDVGTGAGFPGIPLKIANPDVEVVLLDSLNKRVKFLNEVIEQLELKQITAFHGRAEDFGRNADYREKFDISVSRAVANLSVLLEYNLPFVKTGGYFVAYKSGTVDEEIKDAENALKLLGGEIGEVKRFKLPDSDMERTLIYVKKVRMLSKKYPRKAGLPAKEPL